MKVELDIHDQQLIFQALCYFDHYEDEFYDDWFTDGDKANESFHYLYSLLRHVDEIH